MAINVYKSGSKGALGFDRFNEICRHCAVNEVNLGHYVEFDHELSNVLTKSDLCTKCFGSFFVDNRKKLERIPGVIY